METVSRKENPGIVTGAKPGEERPGTTETNNRGYFTIMQVDTTQKLRIVLSDERLAAYETMTPGDGDLDTFCHYAWNLSLSESLYPILQCVEVALRNTIHEAAAIILAATTGSTTQVLSITDLRASL